MFSRALQRDGEGVRLLGEIGQAAGADEVAGRLRGKIRGVGSRAAPVDRLVPCRECAVGGLGGVGVALENLDQSRNGQPCRTGIRRVFAPVGYWQHSTGKAELMNSKGNQRYSQEP